MEYENRVVLFLDILGFRKHVLDTLDKKGNDYTDNQTNISTLYDTLYTMGKIANPSNNENKDVVVTQFSDSIVISFREEDNNMAVYTFEIILKIILELAISKIICRGALSYGKLIHDKNIIFGPALIDAYETESKAAMYPRVIMDRKIYDLSRMYFNRKGTLEIPSRVSEYLSIDLDGKYYIDYFRAAHHIFTSNIALQSYYETLREIIINGLRFQQPDLRVKYGWMKEKYNSYLQSIKSDEAPNLPFEIINYFKGIKALK